MYGRNFRFHQNIIGMQTWRLTSRIELDFNFGAKYQKMGGPTIVKHTELVTFLHFILFFNGDFVGGHLCYTD